MDREEALRTLGLGSLATLPEIKQAYRDLAKVWHPDRFGHDPRLQAKAQEHLKLVNEAFACLSRPAAARDRRPRPRQPPPDPPRAATPPSAPHHAPAPPPLRRRPVRLAVPRWFALAIAAASVVALAGASIRLGNRYVVDPLNRVLAELPGDPVRVTRLPELRWPGWWHTESAPAPSSAEAAPGDDTVPAMSSRPPRTAAAPAAAAPPAPPRPRDRFTVGTSKAEVLRIQGPPTDTAGNVWHYGLSRVVFYGGHVRSWEQGAGPELRAELLRPARVVGGADAPTGTDRFGIGSTKAEVLAAQGQPSAITENVWYYGASRVHFRDGKVKRWESDPSAPLRVRARLRLETREDRGGTGE